LSAVRVRRLAIGVLLALGLSAPAASAQSVTQNLAAILDPQVRAIRSISIPVQVRGSLAVDFRGDAAGGCPVSCDLEGSLLWAPATAAELTVYEYSDHGRREMYGTLIASGARTTAVVTRKLPAPGSCSDVRTDEFFALDFSAEARDHIDMRIAHAPGPQPDADVLTTRCAGPAEGDIASVLPVRRLDRAALLKGETTVDLSNERAFAARGLAGTVRSSVVLALGRPHVDSRRDEPLGERARGGRRYRTMIATYRIERVAGDLVARFHGSAEPALCRSLDSCGASGTVRVSPSVSSGDAVFIASGPARRSRRQLGAALGLLPRSRVAGIDSSGYAFWDADAGQVAGSYANGDRQACNDDEPLGPGSLSFEVTRRRVIATYVGGGYFGDPFRTRCPGPTFVDVTAGGEPVLGSVPLRAFRRPRVVIPLTRAGSFETDAYAGRLEPALELVMRRVDVDTRVAREPGL
jgi:hypothetical protein